jgi:ubiquinone/menaquinone biosynthesis C-methylase UbiE
MPDNKKIRAKPAWNPDNIFTGTAWFYQRYRPGYPDEVFSLLRDKFGLNEDSKVLDLGCGTGQVALNLAPYVSEIIALDPQEEMLQEGKAAAKSSDISNITWLKGESGRLPDMAAKIGKINLTVIARAFHWMDKEQTLKDLYKITFSGGGVAIIADGGPTDGEMLPWKETIQQTVKKWLGEERKAGTEGTYSHPKKRFEAFLKDSKFSKYEEVSYAIERNWSLDEIIGYMYSTSLASPPVLGDKKDAFEADLRERLLEIEPAGRFREPVKTNIMMVWKKRSGE